MTHHLKSMLVAGAIGLSASLLAPPPVADAQVRATGRTSVSGQGGNRAASGANRSTANVDRSSSAGNRAATNSGNRNTANVDRSRTNTNVNSTRGSNNNINTGDININTDHDNGYDWDDDYHPVARGMAVGAAAAVTSAVVGSMIYGLPPGCSPYRTTYYNCNGVYYAQQYQGDTVVYVVVDQP